jgi:hypothetical protein
VYVKKRNANNEFLKAKARMCVLGNLKTSPRKGQEPMKVPSEIILQNILDPTSNYLNAKSLEANTCSMKLRDEEKAPILVSKLTSTLADRVTSPPSSSSSSSFSSSPSSFSSSSSSSSSSV